MLEKYIRTDFKIQTDLDGGYAKVAAFSPDVYIPPEIAEYAANVKPDPRFALLHAIAMSDSGVWGFNLNGDGFRAAELLGLQTQEEANKNVGPTKGIPVPRYKTFEQARYYRNHANSPFDPAYGDFPVAAWNEPMRRIELIIRIYRVDVPELNGHGAPDLIAKYERRGYLNGSMGTRISHERCLACGNENEYVADRCDCLRNHMNEILPDGRIVAADNFKPRMFDYSDVEIPADVCAQTLAKVASASAPGRPNYVRDVDSGIIVPAWYAKHSEMDKRVPAAGTVGAVPVDSAATTPATPSDMSNETIDLLMKSAGYNLDTFVSTATLAGVVLSPTELAMATALAEPDKVASEGFNFAGIRNLSLDNFSASMYSELRSKVAGRSGYSATCPATGWQPDRIGVVKMADYYSYYRRLLDEIPTARFVKAAHTNPYVRELLGQGADEQHARVHNAMFHLAHAGMAV